MERDRNRAGEEEKAVVHCGCVMTGTEDERARKAGGGGGGGGARRRVPRGGGV